MSQSSEQIGPQSACFIGLGSQNLRFKKDSMARNKSPKKNKRSYPPFWERFIPVVLILIAGIITFLIYITIRVALGMAALPF
jgi:hypothetical protein